MDKTNKTIETIDNHVTGLSGVQEEATKSLKPEKSYVSRLARTAVLAGFMAVSALSSGCLRYHDKKPSSESDESSEIDAICSYSRIGPTYKSEAPTHLPYNSPCAKALRRSNYKNETTK